MGRYLDIARRDKGQSEQQQIQDFSFRHNGPLNSSSLMDSSSSAETTKETNLTKEAVELRASLERLEAADILLAISDDGDIRIVRTDPDAHRAVIDGFTIYTPRDAYMYVTLTERERAMLHSFKRQFGGTTAWKANSKSGELTA